MTTTVIVRRPISEVERGVIERRRQRERAQQARRFQRAEQAERPPVAPDGCLAAWTDDERRAYARTLYTAGFLEWEISTLTGLQPRRDVA